MLARSIGSFRCSHAPSSPGNIDPLIRTSLARSFTPFRVNDFAPYITKIMASGAEILMTANFGPDLSSSCRKVSTRLEGQGRRILPQ